MQIRSNLTSRRNCDIILIVSCLLFICIFLLTHLIDSSKVPKDAKFYLNNYLKSQNGLAHDTPTLGERLKAMLACKDYPLETETLQYGGYWLVKNYIRGRLSQHMGCGESITYATNGDYTFFDNLASVVERWLAPISFAIFAPGYDFNATMDSIQYVRNCLPQSDLIRSYVTFHIYFPNDHMPKYIPKNEGDALLWPFDCQLLEAPYESVDRNVMYKSNKNLTYPINVGRNIARKNANTYFVFVCDIELMPSLGLVDHFLNMVLKNVSLVQITYGVDKPRVFPLPVFEIQKNATVPNTKSELLQMLDIKMAIPFHYHVCKNCHLVPKQNEWILANTSQQLNVFTVGKRYGKFAPWEPFYISDNKEPLFDERVTWEGQSNKRIQNYAMCLMDYEYHILHPAFLVHAPGIKKFDKNSGRLKYIPLMNKLIKTKIVPEYQVLYGTNGKCKV